MKRLLCVACAALFALVVTVGCGKPAPAPTPPAPAPETTTGGAPAAADVTWTCSHEGCGTTKTMAADAAAPNC